jgi:hypothetical protein
MHAAVAVHRHTLRTEPRIAQGGARVDRLDVARRVDLVAERGHGGAPEEERQHAGHGPHKQPFVEVDVHGVTAWRARKMKR